MTDTAQLHHECEIANSSSVLISAGYCGNQDRTSFLDEFKVIDSFDVYIYNYCCSNCRNLLAVQWRICHLAQSRLHHLARASSHHFSNPLLCHPPNHLLCHPPLVLILMITVTSYAETLLGIIHTLSV